MQKLAGCLVLAAVALTSGGCTARRYFEAQARVDPQTVALYRTATGVAECPTKADLQGNPKLNRGPGDFREALNIHCLRYKEGGALIYDTAAAASLPDDADKGAVARNRLASILMKHSDDVCTVEMGRLAAREAMVNTGLSTLTSGLATAGSLVSPESLKALLSGAAGFSNATRTHINAEVYRNVLSTAVAKAIQNKRDEQRTAIIRHFEDDPAAYNVDQMIMDVNNYHQTCSFYRGLGLVLTAVSRTEDSPSERNLRASTQLAALNMAMSEAEKRMKQQTPGSDLYKQYEKQFASLSEAHTKKVLEVASITPEGSPTVPPPKKDDNVDEPPVAPPSDQLPASTPPNNQPPADQPPTNEPRDD